jgi:hypothetical protein
MWELPHIASQGFTPIQHFALGMRQLLEQIKAAAQVDKALPYKVFIETKDPAMVKYQ